MVICEEPGALNGGYLGGRAERHLELADARVGHVDEALLELRHGEGEGAAALHHQVLDQHGDGVAVGDDEVDGGFAIRCAAAVFRRVGNVVLQKVL